MFVFQTSFTLSWASYLLARHPQVQQQIFAEVTRTLGHDTVASADDIPRLPLIRGLVKETLRCGAHYLCVFFLKLSVCHIYITLLFSCISQVFFHRHHLPFICLSYYILHCFSQGDERKALLNKSLCTPFLGTGFFQFSPAMDALPRMT